MPGNAVVHGNDVVPKFVDPLALEVGSRNRLGPDSIGVENERSMDPIFMCELGCALGRFQTEVLPAVQIGSGDTVEVDFENSKSCDGPDCANEKLELFVFGPRNEAFVPVKPILDGLAGPGGIELENLGPENRDASQFYGEVTRVALGEPDTVPPEGFQ